MKMNVKKYVLPLVLGSLLLGGCGSSESSYATSETPLYKGESNGFVGSMQDSAMYEEVAEESYYDDYDSQYGDSGADSAEEAINNHGKKLVHTYNLSVQTTDYDEVVSAIDNRIAQYDGYVESSNMNNYDDSRNLSMTIRVPQEKAEKFLDYIGENTNVKNRSENTVDKTLDYVDVDSRMNSYKQELEVMEDLAKRAETVTELLEIENNIAEIRGQIDSYQSQLNSIDNRVSFATIYLDLSEVKEYTYTDPSFIEKIVSGLADSFGEVGDMIVGFIVAIPIFLVGFILFLIPASIVIVVIVLIVKLIIKITNKNSVKNKTVDVKSETINDVIIENSEDNK